MMHVIKLIGAVGDVEGKNITESGAVEESLSEKSCAEAQMSRS